MNLGELVMAQEALQRLILLEWPAAVSYKVARAARPALAELRSYEEQRIKLVQQFGETEGQQTIVKPDKVSEFTAEMSALLQVDVDLEIRTISPDLLDNDEIKIKPADLLLVWFLFEEEDE